MPEQKYVVLRLDGSPVDCPALVLLATDVFAIRAFHDYMALIREFHPSEEYRDKVWEVLREFTEWQEEHADRVKIPD